MAASAAIALKNFDVVQRELELFLREDPTNPLAPAATNNLKILASSRLSAPPAIVGAARSPVRSPVVETVKTFPNSDALKNALASLDQTDEACTDCSRVSEAALLRLRATLRLTPWV